MVVAAAVIEVEVVADVAVVVEIEVVVVSDDEVSVVPTTSVGLNNITNAT